MKHYLFVCLGLSCTLFLPFAAAAVEYQLGGEHRLRGAYFGQNTRIGFNQRIKLSTEFSPNESFESKLWLLTLNKSGSNYFIDYLNMFGYGDIKISDEWMLRLGRLPYQLDNNKIFMGGNDYDPVPYVFDGVKVNYQTESIVLDAVAFFLPKIYNGSCIEKGQYSSTVGVSLKALSLPVQFKTAQVFAMYVLAPSHDEANDPVQNHGCRRSNVSTIYDLIAGAENTSDDTSDTGQRGHMVRSGIGLEGELSILEYKLNAVTHNSAQMSDYNDFELALDGEIKYTTEFDIAFTIGGHYESLEFDPFYYSRHNQSGLLDVVAWGKGAKYGKLGVAYHSPDDFTVGVEGLYFYSIGKDSKGYWGDLSENDALDSLFSKGGPLHVFELDFLLEKHFAGGFALRLIGGIFDLTGAQYMQAQLSTTFTF